MQSKTIRKQQRAKRKTALRWKIRGTANRPRLSVYKSNTSMSAQIIDDQKGITIVSSHMQGKTMEQAKKLGTEIAKLAMSKQITSVVFDRAGFRYHGAIAAVATAAREGGLQF